MEDIRIVFSNIMEKLLKQAHKNKNVLEYKEINDAFKNIPIRRNYKTNVSGNLLTKQGTINVTIDPIWTLRSLMMMIFLKVSA